MKNVSRYNGDLHTLITWATNRNNEKQPRKAPEPYLSWITELLPSNCRAGIAHWVGVLTPDSPLDGDWHVGYPHIHTQSVNWPAESTTAITYLTVPEEGGEFALGGLSPDDPYELIKPEPGLTVMCDAATWHGVKPVKKGTRIALITTGHPICTTG